MRISILVLVFGIAALLSLGGTAYASQFSTLSFAFPFLRGSIELPEEAHPLDTILCNLSLAAYVDVTLNNFTVTISGMVGENWQTLKTEQIISQHMAMGENISRQILVILPQNLSERLNCTVEASTDIGRGNTAFYATYIRTITYDGLLNAYEVLSTNYTKLQDDQNQLLNESNQREDDYTYIKAKYDASTAELNIVRTLMYVFVISTVILTATTVYFRKKAPYIVLQKGASAKDSKREKMS